MTSSELLSLLEADVVAAAPRLLGWHLVHGGLRAQIVEVEAYRSKDDPGSHAHRSRTPRNEPMFGRAGTAYVYFTYGNHWMLNVVGQPLEEAGAVLIRAAKPLQGLEQMYARRPKATRDQALLSGPGKLAAAFALTGEYGGHDLFSGAELRIEPGVLVDKVLVGPRIGLAPGRGDEILWRFVDAQELPWVSRPLKNLA